MTQAAVAFPLFGASPVSAAILTSSWVHEASSSRLANKTGFGNPQYA